MKDFYGNEILSAPQKINESYPRRTIRVCKALIIAMVFFMGALRPGVMASWDLYIMDSGKWEVLVYDIKSKSKCEAYRDIFISRGYDMKCESRVTK